VSVFPPEEELSAILNHYKTPRLSVWIRNPDFPLLPSVR